MPDRSANGESVQEKRTSPAARTERASQLLPSVQIGFEGQLRLLRAYANASDGGQRAVSLGRLASLAQVNYTTASSCNAFFAASQFIVKGKQGYSPSEGLLEFARQYPWSEEKATESLRGMMQDTWYAKELKVLFAITPEMTEEELILALGSASGARKAQRGAIETLVRFALYAGMLSQDPVTSKYSFAGYENTVRTRPAELTIGATGPEIRVSSPTEQSTQASLAVNLNISLDLSRDDCAVQVGRVRRLLEDLGFHLAMPTLGTGSVPEEHGGSKRAQV